MSAGGARLLQLLTLLKQHCREAERWRARWRARTAANFKLRLAVLLGISLLNVAVGAVLYKWTASEEADWQSAFFTVYAVLYGIPGSDVTNAPTPLATWVLNAIFIFGLMVFATTLAMITDEVNSLLSSARSGKAPLMLSGHILLLNWNSQVSFIIDQLEAVQAAGDGHPFAGKPIVILADKDKEEMDSLVVSFMKRHELEVHTRSGKPYKLDHLERVSAGDAAAVLVLHPPEEDDSAGLGDGSSVSSSVLGGGGDDSDTVGSAALKMQTMMALTALLQGKKTAVVVQVPESSSNDTGQLLVLDQVLEMAGHETHLLDLPVKKMVTSLAVQTTLQPWSATIYHNILQYGLQPGITFVELPTALCNRQTSCSSTISSSSSGASTSVDILPPSAKKAQHSRSSIHSCNRVGSYAVYEDVRVHFGSQMLVLGFIRRRQLVLNPAEGSMLLPGDVLVGLTKRVQGVSTKVRRSWLDPSCISLLQQKAASLMTKASAPSAAAAGALVSATAAAAEGKVNTAAALAGQSDMPTSTSTRQQDQHQQLQQHELAARSVSSKLESICETSMEHPPAPEQVCKDTRKTSDTPGKSAATIRLADITDSVEAPGAAGPALESSSLQAPLSAPAATPAQAAAGGPDPSRSSLPEVPRPADSTSMSNDHPCDSAAQKDQYQAAAAEESKSGTIRSRMDSGALLDGQLLQVKPAAAVAASPAPVVSSSRDTLSQEALPEGHTHSSAGLASRSAGNLSPSVLTTPPPPPPPPQPPAPADNEVPISSQPKKSWGSMLRQMCCAAPSTKDSIVTKQPATPVSAGSLNSKSSTVNGKSKSNLSLKKGAAALTKGVSGAVTGVTGAVGTVTGTAVTGAVTGVAAVAEGAANVSKTVVTGATSAVSTVADGAVSLSKSVVTGATSAVGTVADGALTISKGAVSAVTTVGSAVGTAVTSTAVLVKSEVTSLGSATSKLVTSKSTDGDVVSEQAPGWSPASWIFGAGRKLQQSTAKTLANMRLSKLGTVERGPPKRKLRLVIAGFAVSEVIDDLLPQFLDFAPPGSHVTCIVRDGEELPEGYDREGVLEQQEQQEDGSIVHHELKYRFLPSSNPTNRDTLAMAGLLAADSILLAADVTLRCSPAKADAQVLAALVEIQHLLASSRVRQDSKASFTTQSTAAASASSSSSSRNIAAAAATGLLSSSKSLLNKATAVSQSLVSSTGESSRDGCGTFERQQQLAWEARASAPHVVACVATTSAKAVAAAFFGPPNAAAIATHHNSDNSSSSCGVVGQGLFTYELLVPGEIEGAVLVQAAQQPLYEQVVHQLLATSEGCELYLLPPESFGFIADETLTFAEVSEVGRLLRKTVLGVVAGGRVVLVPDSSWTWQVFSQDRIAAVAECW